MTMVIFIPVHISLRRELQLNEITISMIVNSLPLSMLWIIGAITSRAQVTQ